MAALDTTRLLHGTPWPLPRHLFKGGRASDCLRTIYTASDGKS